MTFAALSAGEPEVAAGMGGPESLVEFWTCWLPPGVGKRYITRMEIIYIYILYNSPKFHMEPENDCFQRELSFLGTSFWIPC